MLLPRGLTKKKRDVVLAKKRRIEDKERPFRQAADSQLVDDTTSTQAGSRLEQVVWSSAVYISLFETEFSSETLRLIRRPITDFVKCQSIALKARLTDMPPVNLVAAIRAVGGEHVQVRLALDAMEQEEAAGSAFEFRLLATNGVDIVEETSHVAYLESVPAPYQSISGIVDLVHRNCDIGAAAASRLQGITPIGLTAKNEPSYEQVLVTFSNNLDREEFLERIPWHDQASSDRSPAFCACLRACSLERFASLREEYLTYQNTLNLQITTKSSTTTHQQPTFEPPQTAPSRLQAAPPPPTLPFRSYNLAYPPGRLLFLRNVSTTTNKTAIRADMTAFLAERSSVDYVDWSKGHDTAHIRLGKAIDEQALAGMLEPGRLEGDSKVELLAGERESLYWSRLPEKIRAAAMNS
ncbi:hypothetical protein FFLO_00670 [Filobasidium floriforme]|uniref:XRRM domain-containing protein n=1 Tax=Filobasidium floriforme TaxID=5210 RepID=A0A8K0JRD4_9TREE|nr:uncharacterized protein HD553DRAFT_212268 [Filobasidium floriforme]KAG7571318.1 hypothetical protein FFLO_00670 [Filobasidium floriforme]KAH8086268.1 hypothetical protein HD553DRAFT_212268 [Filobasidium floriforme]